MAPKTERTTIPSPAPLNEETEDIGEFKVSTTQLPVMSSLPVMARIANIAMPILGQLAPFIEQTADGELRMKKMDPQKMAPALAAIFAQIGEDQIVSLARDLLRTTKVMRTLPNGERKFADLDSDAAINAVFGGDLKTVLAVMAFALKVYFASFFSGRGSNDAAATTETESP